MIFRFSPFLQRSNFIRRSFSNFSVVDALRDPTLMIIDVTEKDEFDMTKRSGLLPQGSINIPVGDAPVKLKLIAADKATPIVFYCMHGVRSRMVAKLAREMGYMNAFAMTDANEVNEALKKVRKQP